MSRLVTGAIIVFCQWYLAISNAIGWSQPGVKHGVRYVYAGKIIAIHHNLELVHWRVNEQRWVGAPRATPDYVRRGVIVPSSRFGNNSRALWSSMKVSADVVKALGCWRGCALLCRQVVSYGLISIIKRVV